MKYLPAAYLIWALPLLIALCWLTPPWQAPDEPAHLVRADQIAHGQFIGARHGPLLAGGKSDPGIAHSADALRTVPFHAEVKVSPYMLAQAGSFAWGKRAFVANANTALYPPFLYLPQAATVRLGRAAHLSIVLTLRLARVAAAMAASLICAAAFSCARRTAPLLIIIAMLPMNLFLFASASQDGLMLACTMLAIGLLDRIIDAGRDATKLEAAAVIILLALVVMARPPYAPLALLGLLLTRRLGWHAVTASAAILACAVAWTTLAALRVVVPMNGASLGGQLHFCLAHPHAVWAALGTTWTMFSNELVLEVIGQLGWLDTRVAPWLYTLAELLLAVGAMSTLDGRSRRPAIVVLGVLGTFAAIVLTQYLTWTHVGAGWVRGVQGRYFEVLLAVCALCLPGIPALAPATRPAGITAAGVMALAAPFVVLKAIVWRYYIG